MGKKKKAELKAFSREEYNAKIEENKQKIEKIFRSIFEQSQLGPAAIEEKNQAVRGLFKMLGNLSLNNTNNERKESFKNNIASNILDGLKYEDAAVEQIAASLNTRYNLYKNMQNINLLSYVDDNYIIQKGELIQEGEQQEAQDRRDATSFGFVIVEKEAEELLKSDQGREESSSAESSKSGQYVKNLLQQDTPRLASINQIK